jgi:integrase
MKQHRVNLTTVCNGKAKIYKRTDNKKPIWYVRTKNATGRGYKIQSTKTIDKSEAIEFAENWLMELRFKVKNNIVTNNRTVAQISKIYIDNLQTEIDAGITNERQMRDYQPIVETYINGFFGKKNIDGLKQSDIESFKKWCLVYWVTGDGSKQKEYVYQRNGKYIKNPARRPKVQLSTTSMNKICVVLRAIFKLAVQQKALNEADAPKISKTMDGHTKRSKEDSRRPAFTKSEYDTLVHELMNWHSKAKDTDQIQRRLLLNDYVLILANTGIRPGTESDGLRWKDVQDVIQDGNTYIQLSIDGKTGKRQPIAMDRARKYFDRIKQRRTDFLGHSPSQNEYVFCLPDGTHIKNDYFRSAFKRSLKAFGLLKDSYGKNRSPYSLRHTYATLRLAKGVGLEELSKNMGTSYKMIQLHYSHITPLLMSESLTRI